MKSFKIFISEVDAKDIDPKLAYHDELNPSIWKDGKLDSKVKQTLIRIAKEFVEFIEMTDDEIEDIVLTGSNANYNWTKLSDIDLHLIANIDGNCVSCKGVDFDSCMRAKKTLWNNEHNITIHGWPVELYIEPKSERTVGSAGVYSIKNDTWVKEPTKEKVDMKDPSIVLKAKGIMDEIDNAIDNKVDDVKTLKDLKTRIRLMRASGLEKGGEFSVENLAFKTLRNNGYVDKFSKYITGLEDHQLSLE